MSSGAAISPAAMDAKAWEELLEVGIALSSTRDLRTLLELILSEARRLTGADAGTLYLKSGNELRAEVAQCQTFVNRWGAEKAASVFRSFSVNIDMSSIAGAAAATREVVNIPDVQRLGDGAPFHYNPAFDRAHDYDTRSNLAVPLLTREGEVVGVLQLINAQQGGDVIPFDEPRVKLARALASQAAVAIQNTLLTASLRRAHLDTLRRLGIAAEWRDRETANHIMRVSEYAVIIARDLGWPEEEIERLRHACTMHDVGKVGIPDAILHKPGRLDPEERRAMEVHTIIGANILARADNEVMRWGHLIALGHHEKWDGTGYPQRLRGEAIPLLCRIAAVADVYDALANQRPYKPALPPEKVRQILCEETGRAFDPQIAAIAVARLADFDAIRQRYADREEDFRKFEDLAAVRLEEA
ncbi:MAG: GAF domain-containing protein [Planctomycetota bacterium]|nr:GAF domain-containing protein [Planctomycetota bacterium]